MERFGYKSSHNLHGAILLRKSALPIAKWRF